MRGSFLRAAGGALAAAIALSAAALAQDPPSAPPALSEKERAKQQRIEEYLRKKEERIAREDLQRAEKEQAKAAPPAAEPAAVASGAVVAAPPKAKHKAKLPQGLAQAQAAVRTSGLAKDPTVLAYLDRVDRQEASPQQLAAFGNFVSDGGLPYEAIEYYRAALEAEKKDSLLWMNYGTLLRQVGDLGGAMSAYGRSLELSPNNALAHYNVGTVLDAQGNYDEAVEAFTVALRIDPSLGEPATNPQAANNDRLVAAKLKLYQETSGRLSLPLSPIKGGEIEAPAKASEPPPDRP